MLNILFWVIFGGIIGFIADLIDKEHSRGILVNIVVGIAGAVVGGWISGLLGLNINEGFNLLNIIFSVIGALIVLSVFRFIARK
jgi:uncharacterized membrane protein YeaQ/YmgE (transglycosylase-associated protein family)